VQLISAVGTGAFIILVLFWKEFKVVTFDPEFARANGLPIRFFNFLLSTLIVVAVVLGLQLAGVILMVGMLIAPGIAARQWTHKLDQMVILAAVFGAFAGSTGAIISGVDADIPTGPMIIVMAFLVVMVSIGFAPGRGLVWTLVRQSQDRRRFAAQNALRDLYRYCQSHNAPAPESFLVGVHGSRLGLNQLEQRGYAQKSGDRWSLTDAGEKVAARDAYNQQLWDTYRQYGYELDLPVVAENRQQDIHKVLPGQAVELLERKMKGAVR
jgi:manganese/zinc/iron transport system permease protein